MTQLREQLNQGWCVVEFTKKNGEHTKMLCTTKPEYVPESFQPKGEGRPEPEGQIRVYAADRAGWRTVTESQVTDFREW
jgi:hypothetical protein